MSDAPRVLVVCTGNICRSPVAERLLQAALPGVEVLSAGTGALVGEPMEPEAAALVSRAGGDAEGHAAQQLTPALVRSSALVLTATREHRSAAVRLAPAAVRRAFTLREAARLAQARGGDVEGATPAERLASLTALMARARGTLPLAEPDDDDVVDPYRRGPEAWAATEEQLLPAVHALTGVLAAR